MQNLYCHVQKTSVCVSGAIFHNGGRRLDVRLGIDCTWAVESLERRSYTHSYAWSERTKSTSSTGLCGRSIGHLKVDPTL